LKDAKRRGAVEELAPFLFFSGKIGRGIRRNVARCSIGRDPLMRENPLGNRMRLTMRLYFLFMVFLSLPSCRPIPSLVKPRLEEKGAVYVYLQPFPQEAERLTFRLEGISAVRGDGEIFPLSLQIKEFNGKDLKRERLMASGELPPGQYAGLSFRLKDATLKGEEGKIALVPAEEMSERSIPFAVARGKAVVLSIRFRYRDSVREGFRFDPSFDGTIPGKIAAGMVGLVTSRGANTVTMFDKTTGHVFGIVPTGSSPAGIVLDPVTRKAYVAITGEDGVETIDVLEASVIDRQRLTTGDNPVELALTPDGKTLLSVNSGSNTVSIIDSSSLIETKRLQVGMGPQSILVDRNGRRAYVFNTLSNTISVVDIGAGAVAATVAVESGPVRGQFNRAGNRLYVLHRNSPYLVILDPLSLSVVRRINIGTGGTALKVNSRTDLIYLARRFGEEVDIFDPFSFLPIDSVRAGGEASYLAIDAEGNKLLIVLPTENRVKIVHLVGNRTAAEVDVGEAPHFVTISGEN
jgi:YVTN family beta-propeller protein